MSRSLLPLLLLVACSGATDPAPLTIPQLGRYRYTTNLTKLGGGTYAGEMILTAADTEAVSGSWNVAGYGPTMDLGFWNTDAYVVSAAPDIAEAADLINHRFSTTTEGATCSMRAIYILPGGGIGSEPYRCQLTYLGP